MTVAAYLIDYPVILTADPEQSALITIIDPCLDPVVLYATSQNSPVEYRYGNSPRLDFFLVPFYVTPLACPFTYECSIFSGPLNTLCSLSDGSTVASFDVLSGDYFLETIDIDNYPPGDYVFEIKGTVGSKSDFASWTLTIVDPCPDAVFFLQANPFGNVTYYLRDP